MNPNSHAALLADSAELRLRLEQAKRIGLPVGLDWRQANARGLRLEQMLVNELRGSMPTGTGPGTEFQVACALQRFQSWATSPF